MLDTECKALRDYRTSKGWTLEEAETHLGLVKSYISELERGIRPMTLKAARKLEEKTGGALKAQQLLFNGESAS